MGGHRLGHLPIRGVPAEGAAQLRGDGPCGAAGHQAHQQLHGGQDALRRGAGRRVPVVLLHAQQPPVPGHGGLDVGAAYVDAAAHAPVRAPHRLPQPGQKRAALRLGLRQRRQTSDVPDGEGEGSPAEAPAQPVGDVDDLAIAAAAGPVHLEHLLHLPQQGRGVLLPEVQVKSRLPGAEGGQGIIRAGCGVPGHEVPLLRGLPPGQGHGQLPQAPVLQLKLQDHRHGVGTALPHVADPHGTPRPGLRDPLIQHENLLSSPQKRAAGAALLGKLTVTARGPRPARIPGGTPRPRCRCACSGGYTPSGRCGYRPAERDSSGKSP